MAYNEYLKTHMEKKIEMKVFLTSKTMLTGKILSFDDDCIVLNKCMILRDQIISVDEQ
jgi:sRNA-binding regulator protein Hfq